VATTEVEGFAAVLDVGTPYAADVLCRAILESTSLVWWLLEPDIGAQRRLARALAYRLRSAIEAERAVEHLGLADDEDRSGYGERRAEVIGAIEELGLEYRAVRGGRPITVGGETLPGYSARVSALVRAVWPQAGLPYALLSQVGHGELVGLARGSLETGTAEPGRAPSPSDRFWIWHDSYLVLGSLALAAHRAAFFLGLDEETDLLSAWMTECQDALGGLRPTEESAAVADTDGSQGEPTLDTRRLKPL
jgi:hypothetical protein